MANNLVQFENLDFADLTRNSERCYDANKKDPMSYATEGPYGISVITNTDDWLCASGIHLATLDRQIQETRTVSPRFACLTPTQEDAVISYHADKLAEYQRDIDPEQEAWRSARIKASAERILFCGSRLLGGVYFKQKDNGLKGGMFFALHLAKELPVEVIKQEIARRSFTAEILSQVFDRARSVETSEDAPQRNHLRVVGTHVAAAA